MRKSNRKPLWSIAILIAVLALVAAACSSDDSGDDTTTTAAAAAATTTTAAAAATTTTAAAAATTTAAPGAVCDASIAVIFPITGPVAFIGEVQLNWAQYAIDLWNSDMGWDVQLVEGDNMFDVAQSATLAAQFIDNGDILGVIGPAGSDKVDAAGAVFEDGDANLTFISPSSTQVGLAGTYNGMLRTVPTDDTQGPTTAAFMIDGGAAKVFMIDDQSSYSTGLADETQAALEAEGVEVSRESVSQDVTDFSALVATIPDDADWVYLPWQVAANGQILGDQMAEQGKDIPIFGSDGMDSDEFTIPGSVVAAFAPNIADIPESVELLEGFLAEYPATNSFGPPTFAAVMVELEAIDALCQAGDDLTRENVLTAVKATNQSSSILGQPISFTEDGDLVGGKFFISEIQEDGSKVLTG
jgi:branched-chain amino acid transport system substrate-binding protein